MAIISLNRHVTRHHGHPNRCFHFYLNIFHSFDDDAESETEKKNTFSLSNSIFAFRFVAVAYACDELRVYNVYMYWLWHYVRPFVYGPSS